MPDIKNIDSEEGYYTDYNEKETKNTSSKEFPLKKIMVVLLIIFVIGIVLILAINLFSQGNNLLFFSGDGSIFKQNVTVSKNGQMIESFYSDGNNLVLKGNPLDSIKGKISSPLLSGGKKNGKITITGGGGRITILNSGEGFFIDEKGNVIFTVSPSDLIDLDEYYDENSNEYIFPEDFNYSTTFEFIVTDENTGEETIIIAPVDFIFSNQNSNSCIALNRSFINESTHYGSLTAGVLVDVLCESYSNLTSGVVWESERMGNVELIFGNYNYASVLADYNKAVLPIPPTGEYPLIIIFTPFKEAAGKKAYFSVNFTLNGVTSKIDFEVPIDNLEQCVQITPADQLVLKKDDESVSFKVDVSSCYSNRITVSLCDNDSGCSGGTQGGINLSQYSFQLSPKGNSSKLVSITKGDMAGAYGIPIYARVTGASKVLVDEKTVIVEPFNGETVFPEKYVVSTIGTGKDSITVRNNDLAEEVEVNSSICTLYKSSLGISAGANISSYNSQLFGKSWLASLSSDSEKYAGSGKYQAALFSLMGQLEKKRIEVQNESYAKNSSIKKSYLMTADVLAKVNAANDNTDSMLKYLKNVDDKIQAANDYSETDMASQIVSLSTGASTLFTSATFLSADVDAAVAAVNAANATGIACIPSKPGVTAATVATTKAAEASASLVATTSTILGIAGSTYGLYTGMIGLTSDVEEVNSASALNNTKKTIEKLQAAREEAKTALSFAELMLISASIDSFYSISKEDLTAEDYEGDVLTHIQNVLDLLGDAQTYLTNAMDDITIGLPDTKSNVESIISIAASVASLVTMLPGAEANASEVISEMNIAFTSMNTAVAAATPACDVPATSAACCPFVPLGTTAATKLGATNLTGLSTLASVTQYASIVNTCYSLLRTYQTLTDNYAEDYSKAATQMSDLIPKINEAKLAAQALVDFLPTSIDATNWLGVESKKTSDVANYTSEEYGIDDEQYNKKRLNGVVGTVLANAFVNGAYEGGVYSEESNAYLSGASTSSKMCDDKNKLTFADESAWKENCANKVKLTLLDYKLNLLQDAQKPNLSTQGIVTYWDFSNSKVYDVFEEQTVDLLFANTGLTKNTYGVLEFPLTKHIHANPTEVTSNFGPFDVPDESENITYKYHMKFNTVPRKSNNYTKETGANSCSIGILRGDTGNTQSLPKIILSWDWNSVVLPTESQMQNNSNYSRKLNSAVIGTNSPNEPYLDASQLSILISKKLGSLEYFLDSVQTGCPLNPVDEILTQIAPNIVVQSQNETGYTSEEITPTTQKCYLPLTTREYDGKPALYYYLSKSNTSQDADFFNSAKDIQKTNTREEFLTLVDFNAFLMRDGYGIDFQSDFVTSFSTKLFASSYSFLNDQSGLKTYFFNPDRFYFSSKANSLVSKKEWALPDAGKYRVRAVIDFDNTAKLFESSSTAAKIIILLDLIEPVSSDYSPLYYTPIDGFTGLSANNNRIGYGSALSGGYDLPIVNSQGAILSTQQKNSLAKIKLVKSSDFFLLNALPSMRSKILDYSLSLILTNESSIVFTPTTATPLLFEINETQGNRTLLNYSVARENTELISGMNSLFILSKLDGCYDYTGKEESAFVNNGPDYGNGLIFGLYLPIAKNDGLNFVKTVAYAPTQNNYYLKKPLMGTIYSPLSPNATNNDIILSGVPNMKSNNSIGNETVDSLEKIMQGVEAGTICVANLGTREVFFWPEENMFDKKYVGEEFSQKQLSAMNSCTKQQN